MDEGYIKFNCQWLQQAPDAAIDIREINAWRGQMHQAGLIGVYDNGIGFGNISTRLADYPFLISGSATGEISNLTKDHYAVVTDYNFAENRLVCQGPIKASSESLSHAIIYECEPTVNAVIHVHSMNLWEKLMHVLPTTEATVAYGTPEMAMEIKRLLTVSDEIVQHKTIIMGGHEEGILVWGKTMEEAGKRTLALLDS